MRAKVDYSFQKCGTTRNNCVRVLPTCHKSTVQLHLTLTLIQCRRSLNSYYCDLLKWEFSFSCCCSSCPIKANWRRTSDTVTWRSCQVRWRAQLSPARLLFFILFSFFLYLFCLLFCLQVKKEKENNKTVTCERNWSVWLTHTWPVGRGLGQTSFVVISTTSSWDAGRKPLCI